MDESATATLEPPAGAAPTSDRAPGARPSPASTPWPDDAPGPGSSPGSRSGATGAGEDPVSDRELDEALARLARGRGAIDLAIGQGLLALGEGDRLLELGYARRVDYARERLGVPARTAFLFTRLARQLRDRPVLRRALVAGLVTPRKALAVASVARGDREAAWTAAAVALSLGELERRVRAEGAEPGTEAFEVEVLRLRMTPEAQDRLDGALEAARVLLGPDRPRWQLVEAIAMEWLGGHGAWMEEGEEGGAGGDGESAPASGVLDWAERGRELERLLAAVGETEEPWPASAHAIDARLRRLVEARRSFDEPFGRLAERVSTTRVWWRLGWRSFADYCRERLGMAARTVRERIWLERRMCALPELREALASGRLTFSKALLVARDATPDDVAARIEEAASTTWQQTERGSTTEEDRRDRAAGVRRIRGPKEAMETVSIGIACAQAYFAGRGETVAAGEALARMADAFVAVWREEVMRIRAGLPADRREVLGRTGGLCAVPGCSRAAEHEHHVRLRSRGGGEEVWNRIGCCDRHHLLGIHLGRLFVTGRAGERLEWRLGGGIGAELWETLGADDVRRQA